MSDRDCPQCGMPAIGNRAVRLELYGTGDPIKGCICKSCCTVFVP